MTFIVDFLQTSFSQKIMDYPVGKPNQTTCPASSVRPIAPSDRFRIRHLSGLDSFHRPWKECGRNSNRSNTRHEPVPDELGAVKPNGKALCQGRQRKNSARGVARSRAFVIGTIPKKLRWITPFDCGSAIGWVWNLIFGGIAGRNNVRLQILSAPQFL